MVTAQFHQHSTNNGPKNRQPNSSNHKNTTPSGSFNFCNQYNLLPRITISSPSRIPPEATTSVFYVNFVISLVTLQNFVAPKHTMLLKHMLILSIDTYTSNSPSTWVVDSGASHHITNNSQSPRCSLLSIYKRSWFLLLNFVDNIWLQLSFFLIFLLWRIWARGHVFFKPRVMLISMSGPPTWTNQSHLVLKNILLHQHLHHCIYYMLILAILNLVLPKLVSLLSTY